MSEELQHKNVRLSDTPSPMNVSMTALEDYHALAAFTVPSIHRGSLAQDQPGGGFDIAPGPNQEGQESKAFSQSHRQS